MPYKLRQWPPSVYPKEANKFPEALEAIDVALRDLARYGPAPEGHAFKPLGKKRGYLWQINIRVPKRQVRILYAPIGEMIVVFKIHKKSSPQEQEREYQNAMARKAEVERLLRNGVLESYDRLPSLH